MKRETFDTRAKTVKLSKNSITYKTLVKMLKGDTSKQFINVSTRRNIEDRVADVVYYAEKMGIKISWGHDYDVAPRGGALGKFVRIPNKKQCFR